MTDFVVHALHIAATKTIAQADHVRLSVADQEALANALSAPVKPNAALKRAFSKVGRPTIAHVYGSCNSERSDQVMH